jgi:threonine dehydrogenase-like Zn-dependent dehydrogenase
MRQLTFIQPKTALEWHEVAEPTLENPEQAIVRPLAVASCDLDGAVVHGHTPWRKGPFAFGHEFVAEVVEVGAAVTGFKPGDRVVVPFQISCGKCERCQRGLTGSCSAVKPGAMYGLAPLAGEWGGALSELVRVPFAQAMLMPVPDGIAPATLASLSDNMSDAWRTVGPYLQEMPGAPVLILGGAMAGSIGLYAVAIAAALGASRIDYVDKNPFRLELAQKLGANPLELGESMPKRFGSYPITVDAGAIPEGLVSVLRSTEAGGTCTSTAIYFTPVALPLLEMYTTGVTLKTNRVHSRATSPHVLELIQSGRLNPDLITSDTVGWDDAGEAFLNYKTKLIVTR